MAYFWFWLAFSFLLTHEMDAVRRHEWQIFPLLARINDDERGFIIFTALHVPLYGFLFWGLFKNGTTINQSFVAGFNIFLYNPCAAASAFNQASQISIQQLVFVGAHSGCWNCRWRRSAVSFITVVVF